MSDVPKVFCVVTVLLMIASTTGAVMADVAPERGEGGVDDHLVNEGWFDRMLEWADEQSSVYTNTGDEVPLDATPFFISNDLMETTSSRATGSRTLNACGSGYNQEGSGDHAYLLVASGDSNYPNASKRQQILDEFDDVIWPNDTTVFGGISTNMIDICVYTMDGAGGVGGYFSGGDNIWIDAADINTWGFQIMAHEFQHMIHRQHDSNEDLWLNEGNSDLAIVICYGGSASGVLSHIMAFEGNPDNDLTRFDNQGYDYGSALAYITYIWEHYGGNSTINDLVDNWRNGISSVSNTLSNNGYSDTGTEAFYKWTVANIMDDTSFDGGKWGYDSIDVEVHSTDKNVFPTQGSGSVNQWAADYYTFTHSSQNNQNLEITFDGGSGDFRAYVAMEGRGGTEDKVARMNLDGSNDGDYTVEDFGSLGDYNEVHLVIAAASSGGSYSWDADLLDVTPPITTMQVIPASPDGPDGWYVTQPTVTLQSNEPGASIYYHWDSETDSIYSGQLTIPEGEHTLYFHAEDTANNIEVEQGFDFKVDSIPSVTTATVNPGTPDGEDGWYVTSPTVGLSSSETADIFYRWNEEEFKEYTGQLTAPEGDNELEFYSVDLRDHTEDTKRVRLKVDTIVPETNLSLSPENGSGLDGWYTSPPTLRLENSEEEAQVFYWWDTEEQAEYMGDIIAPEGEHTIHFYSRDKAGNEEMVRTEVIKVDTIYPESQMTIDPAEPDGENEWYVTTPIIALSSKDDTTSSIYFKFNEEEEYMEYEEELEVPDGVHILYWYAQDPAGNREAEHAYEIMVDTTVPETVLKVEPDKDEREWFTEMPGIEFNKSEDDADVFYHWDTNDESKFSGTLLIPEGRHVLYFRSVDEAGNEEQEKRREFRVDTRKPVAVLNGPVTGEVGQAVVWDATSSKDSQEIVEYRFDFGDGEDSDWTTKTKVTHTYKRAGTFSVSLTVRDQAGLESEPQVKQIKVTKDDDTGGSGGGIWPGDDDGDGDEPFYKKSINIVGRDLPLWMILAFLILIICIVLAVGMGARRRGRRKRERNAMEMEADIDRRWKPRDDADIAYDSGPRIRHTTDETMAYPSYEPVETGARPDGSVKADPGPVFEPVEEDPPQNNWEPAPEPEPDIAPSPEPGPVSDQETVTRTPTATAAPVPRTEEKRPAPPRREEIRRDTGEARPRERTVKERPGPVKHSPDPEKGEDGPPEKEDDLDIDSEIDDLLGRLDGI